jgi:hypothetical protein
MPPISEWLQFPARVFFRREDERIYAVMRIGFAAVALLNLIFLWPDRHVFFSDAGMFDPGVARAQADPVYFSIFAFAGSGAAVTCCMAVTALALVMLLLGIATKVAAFWVLVWHLSHIARALPAATGWDMLLRSFAVLVLVSPVGKCWTLPALLSGGAKKLPALVSGHGLVLMRLQVLVIYWQTVLRRFAMPDPNYWANGEFMSYFLLSHHSRWPGPWVLEYGGLLTFATYAAQAAEAAIPVLLWVKKTRWWGMLLGFSLHAGISVFARDLGLFFLAMMMTYPAFLRTGDIEAVQGRVKRWLARRGVQG